MNKRHGSKAKRGRWSSVDVRGWHSLVVEGQESEQMADRTDAPPPVTTALLNPHPSISHPPHGGSVGYGVGAIKNRAGRRSSTPPFTSTQVCMCAPPPRTRSCVHSFIGDATDRCKEAQHLSIKRAWFNTTLLQPRHVCCRFVCMWPEMLHMETAFSVKLSDMTAIKPTCEESVY